MWCSNGPTLEEDIALTNTSLDFLGRARLLYQYAHRLAPKKQGEDYFAYYREPADYKNRYLYEVANGDFAHTMVRQYLIDVFEVIYLDALQNSTDPHLATIADKAIKEARYHQKRSAHWIAILTRSTNEAKQRFTDAFTLLFPHTAQLFAPADYESALVAKHILPDRTKLARAYTAAIKAHHSLAPLALPRRKKVAHPVVVTHGNDFTDFINHMQQLVRKMPNLQW